MKSLAATKTNPIKTDSGERIDHRFRWLADRYADYAKQAGVEMTAYRDGSLPYFCALTDDLKTVALHSLEQNIHIFEELMAQGLSLKDDKQFVWRMLKKLDLTPASDFFDKQEDGDVVEIYTLDGRQIFRNLRFFQVTSFTLEEIMCAHWNEFTRRPAEITQQLFALMVRVASGQVTETTALHEIPTHVFEELVTAKRHLVEITLRYLAPVSMNGTLVGALVINRSRIVE